MMKKAQPKPSVIGIVAFTEAQQTKGHTLCNACAPQFQTWPGITWEEIKRDQALDQTTCASCKKLLTEVTP